MDWYEKDRIEREQRDAEKKHRRELEDADYEREQLQRAAERESQRTEEAKRAARAAREAADEERHFFQEELDARQQTIRELRGKLRSVALRACPIFRQMRLWLGGFPNESPESLHTWTVKTIDALLEELKEDEQRALSELAAKDAVATVADPSEGD